jgi:magnesium transporter
MTTRPEEEHLAELRAIKKEIIYMRRTVWPLRDMLSGLERTSGGLFGKETVPYLRDVYDHVTHIMDSIESYRDLLSSMLDTALTMFSNRLNEIMKVLTIISTVVMPLTLITGIYGMNFQHMPELHQRYGYPAVLALMAVIALFLIRYFRKKKWI